MNTLFILLLVILGYFLKKVDIIEKKAADSLIDIVFYIFLPATLFYSLINLELKPELLLLPLSGFSVALICYGFGFLIANWLKLEQKTEGIFLVSCGAMNQALFVYPFFLIYLGTKGLAYAAFYDIGQASLSLTLGYYIAIKYGRNSGSVRKVITHLMNFPPLWGFVIGLSANYFNIYPFISSIIPFIEILHNCTTPLIMLSLGIFLEPKIEKLNAMLAVIFTRFLFSIGIAYLLALILSLHGMERLTVLIASATPPAMLVLVYSVKEHLDTEFTAALLSICICIGLIYTPFLFSILLQ